MARLEDITAAGSHKNAEILKENPDVIRLTFKYGNERDAMGVYLCGKLANILFPEVMPKLLGIGKDDTGKFYIDAERVALDALHLEAQADLNMPKKAARRFREEHNSHEKVYYKRRAGNESSRMEEITRNFEDAGLPFDAHPYNWTLAENKVRNIDFKSAWMDPYNRTKRHLTSRRSGKLS